MSLLGSDVAERSLTTEYASAEGRDEPVRSRAKRTQSNPFEPNEKPRFQLKNAEKSRNRSSRNRRNEPIAASAAVVRRPRRIPFSIGISEAFRYKLPLAAISGGLGLYERRR